MDITSTNIAKDLSSERQQEIVAEAHEGFLADLDTRSDWEDRLEEWTRLALQVREEKTYPWPKSSNVKYPLLTTAAMQFNARSFPSLIPSNGELVRVKVIGKDPQGQKKARADRLSSFMSYQVLNEMPNWEEETDKLLTILPIIGCVFRKTYFDPLLGTNVSSLVYPKDFVINYWTTGIETSSRYSQIIPLNKNEIQARVNAGLFLDQDLGEPKLPDKKDSANPTDVKPAQADDTTPYTIIEQHTWLDLDDDDYKEPYVVTFDLESKKLLRIVARYDQKSMKMDGEKVVSITPFTYYTKYSFIPNPEGGFYDIGFGLLLGSLNESVNTLINQLIDAGSLSNLQSGFIAKGLRIKLGEQRFQPGEWKYVNATGDDLKKSIFPLPVRDPSNVLFQLLGMLIQSGKELASVSEIFVGKMPGQNTPATTTQATIEQGMKLFTSIFKRVFRSMTKEFRRLYELNARYYPVEKYVAVVDDPQAAQDFQGPADDISPAADPGATTDVEKQNRAQAALSLVQLGTVNPQEATKRFLQANNEPDIDLLMAVQPQPNPAQQEMEMKMEMDKQMHQMKMQSEQVMVEVRKALGQIEVQIAQIKQQVEQDRMVLERERMQLEREQLLFKQNLERETLRMRKKESSTQ